MDSGCMLEHDRITHLPEDVICKILSFVTPTKYAIRTSLLSKRWERLWVFSPILILEHHLGTRGESDRNRVLRAISFTNSVDNLLFLRGCSPVEFFKLHFEGKFDSFGMRPSSWVCAVVMCNVRELDLQIDLDNNDLGEFPWCLFTCKTLVALKLGGKFILNLPYRVTLPNLKILSLGWFIYIGDAEIQKLLSGCPVLDDLEILRDDFDQIWSQNVIVSSLKRLTLVSYADRDDEQDIVYRHKIVIDAPNLEFLALTDAWPNDIFVKALPNIVEAHIDIGLLDLRVESEKIDKLLLLLQSVVNVRRLFLDCSTFLILNDDDELNLPRFSNLVFMEIDYSNGPYRLMEFLHSARNLESLSFPCLYILDVPKLKDHFELFDQLNGLAAYLDGFRFPRVVCPDIDLEFRMNDPERVPECLRHSLKFVEIKYYYGGDVERSIVEYLLENAMVLEKITIFFHGNVGIIELLTDLSNHQRPSTELQLNLIDDPRADLVHILDSFLKNCNLMRKAEIVSSSLRSEQLPNTSSKSIGFGKARKQTKKMDELKHKNKK